MFSFKTKIILISVLFMFLIFINKQVNAAEKDFFVGKNLNFTDTKRIPLVDQSKYVYEKNEHPAVYNTNDLNSKPNRILVNNEEDITSESLSEYEAVILELNNNNNTNPFTLSNNEFTSNKISESHLYEPEPLYISNNKLLKLEIEQNTTLYDEITLENEDLFSNDLDDLNNYMVSKDPCSKIQPLVFKEKPISPFINRAKTVYFLTSLSTMIGQSGQIQDAFTKGERLTGGGKSKSDQYGYNNVARNLMNPFSRALKGARVDDSGPIVNYIQHPMFGFGVASYLTASGASAKEVFLVSLADNFIFEYVAEGTYVAPSGIDFLATTGGCIVGYFATKYIFMKPFKAFLDKTSALKAKYNVSFYPIIEPGYSGNGMRVGSQFTIKH
ncbi:MAG: DUF3943 domain-containing protein [Cyanobacteriota bacterium]